MFGEQHGHVQLQEDISAQQISALNQSILPEVWSNLMLVTVLRRLMYCHYYAIYGELRHMRCVTLRQLSGWNTSAHVPARQTTGYGRIATTDGH